MPYSKNVTQEVLQLIGLSPGSQELANLWLAKWDESRLPFLEVLRPTLPLPLLRSAMIQRLTPDGQVRVVHMGQMLAGMAGRDFTSEDFIAITLPDHRAERLHRYRTVADGAVLRVSHSLRLRSGLDHFIEVISLPLQGDPAGDRHVICFMDIGCVSEDEIMPDPEEFARVPEIAEIIPLAKSKIDIAMLAGKQLQRDRQAKIISRAAIKLLLNLMDDAMTALPVAGLDPIDYLLAIAVGSANVSHIENDARLSQQYAGLIEPDSMRRGISRAAISRATSLPLETVRRRINRLVELGVLIEREDGVVLSAGNKFKIGARTDRMHAQAQMVERMFRDLKVRGVSLA